MEMVGVVLLLLALTLIAALSVSHVVTAQEDLDFGDAPEPTFPTTMAGNGASHSILVGFSLGANIDSEPDGQPSLQADGDDINGSDDEDGIIFQSALIPGLQTCIDVFLTNSALVANPMLDGWIDFNGDGYWDPAVEHLWGGLSQPLTSGNNTFCFAVPLNASRGSAYARFRLSDGGFPQPDGPGPIGEVEDYRVYIEFTKWDQPPTRKDETDECYWGWDEISIYGDGASGNPGYPIVADDWECRDARPVTDIHWWGSYEGWYDADPPYEPPPQQYQPSQFHIGIWRDVPAEPPNTPFSHPADLIWEWTVNRADLNEHYAGCDFYTTMQNPDTCFYYDFEIPNDEWFIQDPGQEHVYWLSIAAIYPGNEPPQQYRWGWKTRKPEWNDDAVRIQIPDAPRLGDAYIDGEPIETQDEGSWDTSFVLTSLPTEPSPPQVSIEITQTTDAKLSWRHVMTDTFNNPVTINRYYVYRDASPYQAPTATLLTTIDGPFAPGDVIHIDAGAVGNASPNYYYYVRAAISDKFGNDVLSAYSNHVGEFDFTLVPGT